MKKKKNKRVIYYSDEINDDFAGTKIKTQVVDDKFKFIHKNIFWRFCAFFLYYFIAVPIIWFYTRILLRVKFVNKKAVKKLKKQHYFIYGNHTHIFDAFIPHLISIPTKTNIIVSQDTVSIKGIKNIVQMLGALPLASNLKGMKKFVEAINYYQQKNNIAIFPEAHIWPYYTGVRPFKDNSFSYPVKYNKPVIAFFTAYTKPKGFFSYFRKVNITVYVSDPIYPDEGLSNKEAQKNLRDKVYNFILNSLCRK